MKSKRRHELETNELAELVGSKYDGLQPYILPVLLLLIAIPSCVWLVSYWRKSTINAQASDWTAYFNAQASDDLTSRVDALEDVAKTRSDSTAAVWATQLAGSTSLTEGMSLLYTDKEKAETKLESARQLFQKAVDKAGSNEVLKLRALYGLAQSYEGLSKPEEARKQYEVIVKDSSDSAIGKAARRRLISLLDLGTGKRDPKTGELDLSSCKLKTSIVTFYSEFATYKPKPPVPSSGAGSQDSFDVTRLPSAPDLSFPGVETFIDVEEPSPPAGGSFNPEVPQPPVGVFAPETTVPTPPADPTLPPLPEPSAPADDKPANDKPADDKPADDKPADDKPADDKPADDKPADDKPADDKPADDKPADDKPADDKPADDKPADDKPADDKPADDKPADDKPADDKPADDKPADDKPADDKPADDKPADDKPADDKPADDKPADDKPADEAPAEEKPPTE
ncbi:hypothetical protein [Lignipirellula cremea]|uniref:Histone H1-like nucleoprotein HC2 n=1 Tax=Lignipirellula cremea TaxID=2528010 RepID=A0A518DUG6_9BACT|nr:hypothetical protein [Lignipirellula cremea]QDU95469.1 Histone H1-like nucleoprotein HC2 [Lignipirellula cremea]